MQPVLWQDTSQTGVVRLGLNRRTVVPRLTKRNWRTRAVVRTYDGAWLFIHVVRASSVADDDDDRERVLYSVDVQSEHPRGQEFRQRFATLEEALSYANGRDGGALALGSSPPPRPDYPVEILAESDPEPVDEWLATEWAEA